MSSVYLKISSLFIRTLSKPIANSIKAQAREHEGFRKICISFAQTMHRLDMRLRLGLLQDHAAIDRQIAKEAAEAKAKRQKADPVKPEEASGGAEKEQKKPSKPPRIKPLSEAKAIDSGANFISESFLFSVGLGLIIFETWRSRRKENTRRSDVADQISALKSENQSLAEQVAELRKAIPVTRSTILQASNKDGKPSQEDKSNTSKPDSPSTQSEQEVSKHVR